MTDEHTTALTRDSNSPSAGGDQLPVGMSVGNYVLNGHIAEGGCGTVYRAKHAVLGRPVAIKVLHKDLAGGHPMARRFLMEAMAVNMIRHPSIVDIFDVGELSDGRPYYVMEFLEGIDLDNYIRQHGRMSLAEALTILEPVCGALDAAHRAGFVHRDIKASNIHVGRSDGGPPAIKLLDFGVAKALHAETVGGGLTQAGSRIGSSSTMAPEQIVGAEISPQTDVYSLGVLLFKLIVGRNPFVSNDQRDLDQMHLKAPPPRPSELAPVPAAIDAVVAKAMAKSPRQRHPSAAAFLQDVRAVVAAHAQASEAREQPAVGIYIEARVRDIDESTGQPTDIDTLTEQLTVALESAEAQLSGEGFAITLRAGLALMGAVMVEAADEATAVIRRARTTAERARATLAAAANADSVELIVAVHAAPLALGPSGVLDDSAGGPLMALGDWVPANGGPTVWLSETTRERPAA